MNELEYNSNQDSRFFCTLKDDTCRSPKCANYCAGWEAAEALSKLDHNRLMSSPLAGRVMITSILETVPTDRKQVVIDIAAEHRRSAFSSFINDINFGTE